MMTYNDVDLAINARIKTFSELPHSAFQSSNMPLDGMGAFQIPSNKIWVRWSVNYADTVRTGMGDKPCNRWIGILTFQIFTPKGIGISKANDMAQGLSEHFEYYSYQELEFFEALRSTYGSAYKIGAQSSNDTEYQTNLDVRFRVR